MNNLREEICNKVMHLLGECDFCEEQEDYLPMCVVCGKEYCSKCSQDSTWRFVDTLLCNICNNKVWKEFPKLIAKLKEKEGK